MVIIVANVAFDVANIIFFMVSEDFRCLNYVCNKSFNALFCSIVRKIAGYFMEVLEEKQEKVMENLRIDSSMLFA